MKKGIKSIVQDLKVPVNCIIEDIHHINKLDSPSGTAIDIKNYIVNLSNNFINSINIISKREADFFGIHQVDLRAMK